MSKVDPERFTDNVQNVRQLSPIHQGPKASANVIETTDAAAPEGRLDISLSDKFMKKIAT